MCIKASVLHWGAKLKYSIYTGSYTGIFVLFGFLVFGKIPLKSLWEAVLWENVGAEMLIGCVRNFLVLRICHNVDMGHVS